MVSKEAGNGNSAVVVMDNHVEIRSLRLSSPDVLTFFKEIPDEERDQQAVRSIEIGSMVIARVTASNDMDFVKTRVVELLSAFETRLGSFGTTLDEIVRAKFDPDKADSFVAKANGILLIQMENVRRAAGELLQASENRAAGFYKDSESRITARLSEVDKKRETLDKLLDPKNREGYLGRVLGMIEEFGRSLDGQFSQTDSASFVGKLQACVAEYFGESGRLDAILTEKLAVDQEGKSPLGFLLATLKSEIGSLRDAVMKLQGEKELYDQTTGKGFDFEDQVFDDLQKIARPFGDSVADTSDEAALVSGSKKGDAVYTLAETGDTIVLDSKNYGNMGSLKEMLDYLDAAMKERASKVGVIVVPEASNLQKQVGEWNIYPGNKIITHRAMLEITVKVARLILLKQTSTGEALDVSKIRDIIETVRQKLKEFSTVKSKLTKLANDVRASVDGVQATLDGIRDAINEQLDASLAEFARTAAPTEQGGQAGTV